MAEAETEEDGASVFDFARQGSVASETGLAAEEVRDLLGSIQIYEGEGAVFKVHNTLVRIFINLMIKESGSLLITYEEGIEFTKSLIVKSTQEFPEELQEEIRRLVNARIKSFRFQEIFLDAGFYKYVKQLFNVKNEDLLRALIKIYEILITLNFEANQELVNSILAELSEILAFSSKAEVIAQIIAIFISSSPQSLRFISLEQLAALARGPAQVDLLLEITKLIVIFFRDTPDLAIADHTPLVATIVAALVANLKNTPPTARVSLLLDEGAAGLLAPSQTALLERKTQRRKLIQVLLSYAKEIASESEKGGQALAQALLTDNHTLRAVAEAVVSETRNEEFLMQLLRVCIACCGSLSMEVSEHQTALQAYVSGLVFDFADEILAVIHKSSENYYCKVLANDLFNLTMLLNLHNEDPTLHLFHQLTRLFNHPLD